MSRQPIATESVSSNIQISHDQKIKNSKRHNLERKIEKNNMIKAMEQKNKLFESFGGKEESSSVDIRNASSSMKERVIDGICSIRDSFERKVVPLKAPHLTDPIHSALTSGLSQPRSPAQSSQEPSKLE